MWTNHFLPPRLRPERRGPLGPGGSLPKQHISTIPPNKILQVLTGFLGLRSWFGRGSRNSRSIIIIIFFFFFINTSHRLQGFRAVTGQYDTTRTHTKLTGVSTHEGECHASFCPHTCPYPGQRDLTGRFGHLPLVLTVVFPHLLWLDLRGYKGIEVWKNEP